MSTVSTMPAVLPQATAVCGANPSWCVRGAGHDPAFGCIGDAVRITGPTGTPGEKIGIGVALIETDLDTGNPVLSVDCGLDAVWVSAQEMRDYALQVIAQASGMIRLADQYAALPDRLIL